MRALQEEKNRGLHQNVEGGRRLVRDEHFRLARHAERHAHPLAHAAAHLVGIAGGDALGIGKIDSAQQCRRALDRLRSRERGIVAAQRLHHQRQRR